MSATRIREATIEDARAIAEVQVAGWHAAYRGLVPDAILDAFTVEVRAPKWESNLTDVHEARRTAVLERGGRVVAFATSGPSRDEPESGELWALYVAPDAWRSGAGRALLEDALRFLGQRGYASTMLTVLEGNARAMRFYEAAGFRLEGERLEKDGLGHFRMRCVRT